MAELMAGDTGMADNVQTGAAVTTDVPQTAPSEQKAEPVVFKPPASFKPPEPGDQKDGQWDQVDTWQTLPSGEIQLVKLGDVHMPLPDEKREKGSEPDLAASMVATAPPGLQKMQE
jgi:hypothetical protein